jgi:hypothetical protein
MSTTRIHCALKTRFGVYSYMLLLHAFMVYYDAMKLVRRVIKIERCRMLYR